MILLEFCIVYCTTTASQLYYQNAAILSSHKSQTTSFENIIKWNNNSSTTATSIQLFFQKEDSRKGRESSFLNKSKWWGCTAFSLKIRDIVDSPFFLLSNINVMGNAMLFQENRQYALEMTTYYNEIFSYIDMNFVTHGFWESSFAQQYYYFIRLFTWIVQRNILQLKWQFSGSNSK